MNINSSSSYSASTSLNSTSSSSQLTGLASGLDTDSIVKELLSGIQSKIDKVKQEKQQDEWKQDEYRDVISTISTFSDTYLDNSYGSSTTNNMTSSKFFNSMASTSSSSAVSVVSSSSSAAVGDMSVSVSQLATAASVTGTTIGSGSSITGSEFDISGLSSYERTLALKINNGTADTTVLVDLGGAASSSDVVSDINTAISASSATGAFTASVNSSGQLVFTGANANCTMSVDTASSTSAGLQTAGLTTSSTATNSTTNIQTMTGSAAVDTSNGLSLTLTLDGVSKTLTVAPKQDTTAKTITADTLEDALQSAVQSAFGTAVTATVSDSGSGKGMVTFALDGTYGTEAGHTLAVTGTDTEELGISPGASTNFSTSQTLDALMTQLGGTSSDSYNFTINGKDFSFTKDTTVSAMMSTINSSNVGVTLAYSSFSNAFTMAASETGAAHSITMSDASGGNLLQKMFGATTFTDGSATISGQDAKVTINGISTSRSSNTFTVEGVTLKLTGTTTDSDAATISTTRDTDSIVSGIQKFVDSYNSMLGTIYGYVDADKTYLSYSPLTSDQEDDMTESQIEKWNEKAKEGLLHRNDTIDSFLSSVRSLMYTKPASSNYALYQIGIETSDDYTQQGKLTIDTDALKAAITSDPESIMNLFTDSTNGIGTQLKKVCDNYVKDSYGSTGQMVLEAGIKGGSYESDNEISNEITDLDDQLSDLKDKYTKKQESLWTKMTNLETAISSASNISSYFSSMTSSS